MKIEPSNLAAYICPHVFEDTRPIMYVCRADGDWQFLCGGDDHDDKCHLVGVGHLQDRDSSISELADLPEDWEAERENIDAPWKRSRCE